MMGREKILAETRSPNKMCYEAFLDNEGRLGISKRGCNFIPPINMEIGKNTMPT